MVNIARLDAFEAYRGKSIKLVDGDFNVFLYINEEGRPTASERPLKRRKRIKF
jgi:hypothetical protein